MTSRVVYPLDEEGTVKIDHPQPTNEPNIVLIESTSFQSMQYCFVIPDRCVYYGSTLSSGRRKLVNRFLIDVSRVRRIRGKAHRHFLLRENIYRDFLLRLCR